MSKARSYHEAGESPAPRGKAKESRPASTCALCSARSRAYVYGFRRTARERAVTTSTTFVQAGDKVGRRSGQIKLHRPEDFAPMRKAGALTAEALDLLGRWSSPASPPQRSTSSSSNSPATTAPIRRRSLPRLSQIDLHLDQPCRLPRHPGRQAAARRRHPQHRRDPDRRRLARRRQPHVSSLAKRRGARSG